jgi:glutamate dehydrogenase
LIHLLLKAPIDLIWNGGIGTYVKSESEQHSEVGDRANDSVRVNGSELRCKMFGEGGNLGMTQRGRIEFCLNGGACNTDFIDNSAGVDCSDHEVNIKILIDEQVANGDLTEKQRNKLLVDMTDAVSNLVLSNNYKQTLLLSMAASKALVRTHEYRRFIEYLEGLDRLDRDLEFLPSDTEMMERMARGDALTRPELSVLMSYAKVQLKEELAESNIAEDEVCAESLLRVFPQNLHKTHSSEIQNHKLRKQIIGTQLANGFINDLGISSYYRLSESTGSTPEEIVKAYVVAKHVFRLEAFQAYISTLDYEISSDRQYQLLLGMTRRVRRATSWFLKNRRRGISVRKEVDAFIEALGGVHKLVGELTDNAERHEAWKARASRYNDIGVDSVWINSLSMPDNLYSGLSVVEVRNVSGASLEDSVSMFYKVMDLLRLNAFATLLSDIKVDTFWQASAREAYIDDLEGQLRRLAVELLKNVSGSSVEDKISSWSDSNQLLIDRWLQVSHKVESSGSADFAMCAVALRELADLVNTTCER